jgi:hypothetical protein
VFSFPVGLLYQMEILENEGYLAGREVVYEDEVDPPLVRCLSGFYKNCIMKPFH